jgi:hypothetical protein
MEYMLRLLSSALVLLNLNSSWPLFQNLNWNHVHMGGILEVDFKALYKQKKFTKGIMCFM